MNCPSCQSDLSFHLPVEGPEVEPEEHDLSICFSCGQMLEFGPKGQFLALTDEMFRQLPEESQYYLMKAWNVWNSKFSIRGS